MSENLPEYLTNGFSHHYKLDGSTFTFRGVRSGFYFLTHFSMKFLCATEKPKMGRSVLQRHIWGYAACLCTTKRTPGLYELSNTMCRLCTAKRMPGLYELSNTMCGVNFKIMEHFDKSL